MDNRTSSFQLRFIKKLSNVRVKFARQKSSDLKGPDTFYRGGARSMDLGQGRCRKPFMSQPALSLAMPHSAEPTDADDSLVSSSSSHGPTRARPSWDFHYRATSMDVDPAAWELVSPPGVTATTDPLPTHDSGVTEVPITDSGRIGRSVQPITQQVPAAEHIPINDTTGSTFVASSNSLPSKPAAEPYVVPATNPKIPSPPTSPNLGGRRSPAPRLSALPPRISFANMDGNARLSPSVISRLPPFPILNLPSIPPPTPTASSRPGPQTRLRSMPALPMEGSDDRGEDADHDNAMMESDEEEDMEEDVNEREIGSDEEEGDDVAESSTTGRRSTSDRRQPLPVVDTSRIDLGFLASAGGQRTPKFPRLGDYFTSQPVDREVVPSPGRTPRPVDIGKLSPSLSRRQPMTALPSPGSPRPIMQHQASRSMVNLLTTPSQQDKKPDGSRVKSPALAITPQETQGALPPPDLNLGPSLRRRRSMPTFNATTEPPPYPTFFPHPSTKGHIVQPREEEGREHLPPYTNSLHLCAIMPRKVEFTSPGVQAPDRKWRRVMCVLEGTAFKVYKPPGAAGVGVIGEWWERKVGVGDLTNHVGAPSDGRIRIESARPRQPLERPSKDEGPPTPSPANASEPRQSSDCHHQVPPIKSRGSKLAATLLHPARVVNSSRSSSKTRSSIDTQQEQAGRSSSTLARSTVTNGSSISSGSTPSPSGNHSATPSTSSTYPPSSSRSHFRSHARSTSSTGSNQDPPTPEPKDLIRCYTLQHAESGLGSDYTKRKNVIRVRMEGEQFLLQAADVASVVNWIEGFQAATNIALDLDERPMPKGPMFPRRRRPRRQRADVGPNSSIASGASPSQ